MANRIATNRRRFMKLTAGLGGAALAGCIGEDGEGEYPDNDIEIVVPYAAGGGFDIYARAIAEFLPDHLPTDVDVIVENVTGAGGRTGANTTYRADADGYTFGMWNIPGFAVAQLIMDVEYDVQEVSWVGRVAPQPYLLIVSADSEYQSWEDLRDEDTIQISATGAGATGTIVNFIGAKELGINAEVITGYEGSPAAIEAVVLGDVDARMSNYSDLVGPVQDGDVRPLLATGAEPPEFASDVPTVGDIGEGHLSDLLQVQFMFGGPPEIDDSQLEVIEDAFLQAMESEDMAEWAEDSDMPVNPVGRAEASDIADSALTEFQEYEEELADFIL